MKRINTGDNAFHDGDPLQGTLGTVVTAEWLNNVQEEVAKAVETCAALDPADSGQLAAVLMALARPNRNVLINPTFAINQRAPATNADDTYGHDRWYALTQTGTIAVSTVANAENGTPYMARLTQSQAAAQRMGYAQIVESANCIDLRGQEVTFRVGRLRCSSSQALRMAVLEWTGTADTVTSDVVNDWTSGNFTAGNFFLGANLTVTGVTSQTPGAAALTNGVGLTVTLGNTFTNLIVMVWTEGTLAQNGTLDLAKCQLEWGSMSTPFEVRPIALALAQCLRYGERIKTGTSTADSRYPATASAVDTKTGPIPLQPKRVAPTMTTLVQPSGTKEVRTLGDAAGSAYTTITVASSSANCFACSVNATLASASQVLISSAEFFADAEL